VFWQPNIFLLLLLFDAALESGDLALLKRVIVVVGTDLQNLELLRCALVNGGASLVESVKDGRGPRGLSLGRGQYDSAERFISFINALRGIHILSDLISTIFVLEMAPHMHSLGLCLPYLLDNK
jgi:hypothetical protein